MKALRATPKGYCQLFAACLVALALAFTTPSALAQSTADPGAGSDVTREQIQSVARASLEVERINQEWAPRMRGVTTQDELNAVRRQANEQMVQAIEAEGLDVTTYVEIIEKTQSDPELSERFIRLRRQLQ